MCEAAQEFKIAMLARGLIPPANLIADGRIHRCDAEGKGGKSDGSYLLFLDSVPAGGLQNFRDGIGWTNWRVDMGRRLTPFEETAYQAKIDATRREREGDDARRKTVAQIKAARLWAKARPCKNHAYLSIKGLASGHGARLLGDALVIPMRDETGGLHSLQTIDTKGNKRFLPGGRIRGCYFAIGGKPDGALVIAEGFATGASIHEATGHAVAVALNAGNLLAVAQAMRAKFPDLKIILCADDDFETEGNPGLTKATEAARVIGGFLAVPDFGRSQA